MSGMRVMETDALYINNFINLLANDLIALGTVRVNKSG
jgi:hypothetical protein